MNRTKTRRLKNRKMRKLMRKIISKCLAHLATFFKSLSAQLRRGAPKKTVVSAAKGVATMAT